MITRKAPAFAIGGFSTVSEAEDDVLDSVPVGVQESGQGGE